MAVRRSAPQRDLAPRASWPSSERKKRRSEVLRPPRQRTKQLPIAICLLAVVPRANPPARAQTPAAVAGLQAAVLPSQAPSATVHGRVVEGGTARGIVNADVTLGGLGSVLTDSLGGFRFGHVPHGRYTVQVEALGYRSLERVLAVVRDTVLTLALTPLPIALDTLTVRARKVTVRGRVTDATTRREVVDVAVTMGGRQTLTNPAGGFKLKGVPADVPLPLSLSGFGYLPLDTTVTADRDTTLELVLEPDPLVQGMVGIQVGRLKRRAKPFHSLIMRTLDRTALLDQDGGSAYDMVEERYRFFLPRVVCVLIDEIQAPSVQDGLEQLKYLVPAELQRVEVLNVNGYDMLRVYTRGFMRKMIGGRVPVRMPVVVGGRGQPICK